MKRLRIDALGPLELGWSDGTRLVWVDMARVECTCRRVLEGSAPDDPDARVEEIRGPFLTNLVLGEDGL